MARSEHRLLVGSSDHNPDMLYATGLLTREPLIWLKGEGKPVVVSGRGFSTSAQKALPRLQLFTAAQVVGKGRSEDAAVIRRLLEDRKLKRVVVSENFPHGLARSLRRWKIKVRIASPFFPERPVKTADEVKKISASLTMAEVGLAEAVQAIKRSKVSRDGLLHLGGTPLTCARVRSIIETAVLQAGGHPIAASVGSNWRTHDPAEGGDGPLRPNQPITLAVSPRSRKTGYFGDLARTVVKGRAPEAVRRLFNTVKTARHLAFGLLAPGSATVDVHRAVADYFTREGFSTLPDAAPREGFRSACGHGIGLELHEAPFLRSGSSEILRSGHVVTLEPSLHYPAIGCVRLVDAVWVGPKSARNLAKFETVLEI